MKAENVFDMTRLLSVADGQPFSKEDYAAEAAILAMPQSPAAIRRSAFLALILRQIPEGVIVCDGREQSCSPTLPQSNSRSLIRKDSHLILRRAFGENCSTAPELTWPPRTGL